MLRTIAAAPFNDRLHTAIQGCNVTRISDLVQRTVAIASIGKGTSLPDRQRRSSAMLGPRSNETGSFSSPR